MKFFTNSTFFPDFLRKFPEILQIVHTSPQILTLSAKKNRKIPPKFHQNQTEKAVFFMRRLKFHFHSPKFDADFLLKIEIGAVQRIVNLVDLEKC